MTDLILQTAAKTLGVGLGIAAFVTLIALLGRLIDGLSRLRYKSLVTRVKARGRLAAEDFPEDLKFNSSDWPVGAP